MCYRSTDIEGRLTAPIQRTISTSLGFDEKLDSHFGSDSEGVAAANKFLIDELIPHIFEAFKEDWQHLPPVNPDDPDMRYRYYNYFGDIIPLITVLGRLDAVEFDYDYSEEFITLYHFVIANKEHPLEDPETPSPDR